MAALLLISLSSNKIIIGSQQGIVRIFNPTRLGYRMEDLIYEADLGFPILQVLVGKFLSASDQSLGLAVLHPKKLVVYELLPGKAGDGSNTGGGWDLSLTIAHSLTHSLFKVEVKLIFTYYRRFTSMISALMGSTSLRTI